jgi:hypothetical protein
MRFMMFMIPRGYQPDAPPGEVIEVREVFEMSDFPPHVQKAADTLTVRAPSEARQGS